MKHCCLQFTVSDASHVGLTEITEITEIFYFVCLIMTTESQNFTVIVKMTNKDSKEIFTLWNMGLFQINTALLLTSVQFTLNF